jgi:hypothetical protein
MCYDKMSGSGQIVKPLETNSEHQTVKSRLTGKDIEIGFGPLPAASNPSLGGLVPENPFKSAAQRGYLHSHPEVLGPTALKEWDQASKGLKLPEYVKHKK